jgi:uncharacterized protein YjbI with pentapeptide repeats
MRRASLKGAQLGGADLTGVTVIGTNLKLIRAWRRANREIT